MVSKFVTGDTVAGSSVSVLGPAVPVVSDLSELLTSHVQQQPEHPAIGTADLRTVIKYRELNSLVRSAMAQLFRLGLSPGDTIALVSDNTIEFVVGFLAIVSSGARVAPLNPALRVSELTSRLSELAATALLAPKYINLSDFSDRAIDSVARWSMSVAGSGNTSAVRIVNVNGRMSQPGVIAQTRDTIGGDEIALLMFTAGTTSAPKVVPLTHNNLIASIRGIASVYGLTPQDATLVVMPLFHGHGLIAGLLATLASGGSAYLPSTGVFSAHSFWPDIARLGVTWYTAVPTIHRILLNRADEDYPSSARVPLRFIRSCSAPLDEELAKATSTRFRAPVISAYGMTEASHQVSSNPLPIYGSNNVSSVGLPTGVEVRIVAEDGSEAAPPGSVGEIWIRGATVTTGYLNNSEANHESFVDGWFRTGDLGRKDEDGYLFVTGRIKEMINRGGEKISPGDIDAVLSSNRKVFEAASFGEPDEKYGEIVQAAVVLRPGAEATEAELRDYCRAKLAAFEVPERIYIMTDFPRTAKGSIDRRALAAKSSDDHSSFSGVLAKKPGPTKLVAASHPQKEGTR